LTEGVAFPLSPDFHFDHGVTVLWANPGICIDRINTSRKGKIFCWNPTLFEAEKTQSTIHCI